MVILVTGGVASGKSEYAENISIKLKTDKLVHIQTVISDYENLNKIQIDKIRRQKKGFKNIECTNDLKSINSEDIKDATVLIESISTLLYNAMKHSKKDIVFKIIDEIKFLKEKAENIIIETNEVFSDGNIYDKNTEEYINNMSYINRTLACMADEVVEIVYGIDVHIK